MQVLYNAVIAIIVSIAVTWYFTWYFSKKAEKVAIDISGFMMQEINKNPNYVYPYYVGKGKNRKLQKAVEAKSETYGVVSITATGAGAKEE